MCIGLFEDWYLNKNYKLMNDDNIPGLYEYQCETDKSVLKYSCRYYSGGFGGDTSEAVPYSKCLSK